MPFTPKQLVAAAPVMLESAVSLTKTLPFSFFSSIIFAHPFCKAAFGKSFPSLRNQWYYILYLGE